jgi:hypothetical protein
LIIFTSRSRLAKSAARIDGAIIGVLIIGQIVGYWALGLRYWDLCFKSQR